MLIGGRLAITLMMSKPQSKSTMWARSWSWTMYLSAMGSTCQTRCIIRPRMKLCAITRRTPKLTSGRFRHINTTSWWLMIEMTKVKPNQRTRRTCSANWSKSQCHACRKDWSNSSQTCVLKPTNKVKKCKRLTQTSKKQLWWRQPYNLMIVPIFQEGGSHRCSSISKKTVV